MKQNLNSVRNTRIQLQKDPRVSTPFRFTYFNIISIIIVKLIIGKLALVRYFRIAVNYLRRFVISFSQKIFPETWACQHSSLLRNSNNKNPFTMESKLLSLSASLRPEQSKCDPVQEPRGSLLARKSVIERDTFVVDGRKWQNNCTEPTVSFAVTSSRRLWKIAATNREKRNAR